MRHLVPSIGIAVASVAVGYLDPVAGLLLWLALTGAYISVYKVQ